MTRKDYVSIARAFVKVMPFADEPHHMDQWLDDVRAVANVLAADNPRFDRMRFYAACACSSPSLTADLATLRKLAA